MRKLICGHNATFIAFHPQNLCPECGRRARYELPDIKYQIGEVVWCWPEDMTEPHTACIQAIRVEFDGVEYKVYGLPGWYSEINIYKESDICPKCMNELDPENCDACMEIFRENSIAEGRCPDCGQGSYSYDGGQTELCGCSTRRF